MTMLRRWVGPTILIAFGVATLELSLAWNHADDGWWALGIALAFALALAIGGGSDLLRTMRGGSEV